MAERNYLRDNRAIVVPLPQMAACTMTATTEAGPRPGPAVPSQSTGMALDTSGTLSSTLDDITVRTLEAGNVGTAKVRWKPTADTAYRSWDPPHHISGWERIVSSNTASRYQRPHVIQREADGLLLAAVAYDNTGTATASTPRVYTQGNLGKWAAVDIEDTGAQTSPTLVWLPRGRALCFYTRQVAVAKTQIRMAYSDDEGAAWTIGSNACLTTPIAVAGAAIDRIRAVHLNGQIMLLVWYVDTTDYIAQYVSTDEGGSFQLVESFSAADNACPDAAVYNGTIYVAYINYTAAGTPTTLEPRVRVLSSCSQPLSSAAEVDANGDGAGTNEWGAYAAGAFTAAECALLADVDGSLWLYGLDYDAAGTREVVARRSTDGGATWGYVFDSSHTGANGVLVHWTGDATIHLQGLTVARERGRAVMVHTYNGDTVATDGSLCAAYLGGWSTVGMPEDDSYDAGAWIAGWDVCWVAIDKPSDTGTIWTEALTGAATSTMGAEGNTITTAAGENGYYSAVPVISGSTADGALGEWHFRVTSGTYRCDLRISDGANDFYVRVSVSTTTATLRDLEAGADIGTATVDGDSGVAIRIALDKATGGWATNVGRVRAWWRNTGPYNEGVPADQGPPGDREWTSLGTTSTLTSGATTTCLYRGGFLLEAGTAIVRQLAYGGGTYVAGNIADSVNGVARGHLVPSAASPLHLAGGLRIHGTDGPTVAGDEWAISTDHEYPVEAVNPFLHPSPRRRWRSLGTASAVDITLTGLDLGWRTGDPLGIYLAGCNFATAALYRDTGAANKVCDIDMRAGVTSLRFTRNRDQVISATGAGGVDPSFHFHEGSLVGSHVDFGGADVRKIAQCHAGHWLTAIGPGAYPSARIVLDSYDSGDPTSGTCDIRMQAALFVVESLQTTDTLMLRIPAQDTGTGYLELGTLLIGRVRPLAWQYSRGRSLGMAPNYALTTTRGGARHGRRLGPSRPSTTVSWDEGIQTGGIYTTGTAPDHVTLGTTGGDAWGSPADTARMLPGIYDEIGGAVTPVLLVNSFGQISAATTATTPIQVTDPAALHYGRLMGESMRLEAVPNHSAQENRESGETFRVSVELEHEL